MAAKNLYLLPGVIAAGAKLHRDMQDGGAAPSALTSATGWTVGKGATGNMDLMVGGTKRAANTFSATAQPAAAPVDGTTGDSFRSPTKLTGAITGVSAAFTVISVSAAATGSARARLRAWKSKSITGDNTDAFKLTDAVATTSFACLIAATSVALSTTRTFSAYVKAGTKTNAMLYISDSVTGNFGAQFDLTAGTFSSSTAGGGGTFVSSSITAVGGGWYRLSITGSTAASGTGDLFLQVGPDGIFYTGTGTGTIYTTGYQLEDGSSMSAYEQTSGAAGSVNLLANSDNIIAYSATGGATLALDGTTDPFGYSVTELTAGAQTGSSVTSLTASVEQVSTVSAPFTGSVANEYLFWQLAWEIVTASGSSTADMVLRRNSTAVVSFDLSSASFIAEPPFMVRQAIKRASVY